MRYIISTEDNEGIIGMQLAKWAKEGSIKIIEKADPVVELQAHLEKVTKALETLKKAGYNQQVMKSFIYDQTHVARATIDKILNGQEEFFRQIGALK